MRKWNLIKLLMFLLIPLPIFANNVMPLFIIFGFPLFVFGHVLIIGIELIYYIRVFKPKDKINLFKIVVFINIATTIVGSIIIFLFSLLAGSDYKIFDYLSGYGWEGMNFKFHSIAVSFDFIFMYFSTTCLECILFLKTKLSTTLERNKIIKAITIANAISYLLLIIIYFLLSFLLF